MTDKVQKIREEVERIINRRLNLINGDYFDLNEETNGFTNEIINVIDSLQEEPVSEEIGNYNHTAVLEGLGYQSKEEPVITNEIIRKVIKAERKATWDDARLLSPKLTTEEALIAEIYKRINNG